ncbi:MAG: hypothetical protein IJ043_06270 [Clostridia bacterium]|nr:hypothetical protein [Clostridia bacterium]
MAGLYEAPDLSTLKINQFKGSDSSVPEDQIQPYRAAQCENMIPDANGEVRKRPGILYEKALPWAVALDDGEAVVDVLCGKFPLTKGKNKYGYEYGLWHLFQGKYIEVVKNLYTRPTVVQYGDKYIAFCAAGENERQNSHHIVFGYDALESNATVGYAGIIILDENGVTIYTDGGKKRRLVALRDDGSTEWESKDIAPDDDLLTTPIVIAGGNPEGGGSPYQQVNLLNPWVTESFCCTTEKTSDIYLQVPAGCMSYYSYYSGVKDGVGDLDDYNNRWTGGGAYLNNDSFKVEILCPVQMEDTVTGETVETLRWIKRDIAGGDGFRPAVNRLFLKPDNNKNGYYVTDEGVEVTDFAAGTADGGWIGKSPVAGEDNLRITHLRRDFQDNFIRICCVACGTTFGVGGYKDRLFIGGEGGQITRSEADSYRNRVYYSELENPFYIGDLNYIKLEQNCTVMAVDGTADTLAILTDRGTYFVQAAAQDTTEETGYVLDALFTVSAGMRAPAPINYGNTAVLGGEIVYLSKEGVIAVAYKEHFDERYAEHRSALIDRAMAKDQPQRLISLGRFLLVQCAGGVFWLLDENQPNNEGDKPYASHQYEGFRLSWEPCEAVWAEEDVLKLIHGTNLCRWTLGGGEVFHDNFYPEEANETAISAFWETPWLYGNVFYKNKIFMKLGVLIGEVENADTSVMVDGRKNAEPWENLWEYDGTLCVLHYGRIDYRLFTYSTEPGCPVIARKIKIKKAKRVKLRFSNNLIDQPFILQGFGMDYVQED